LLEKETGSETLTELAGEDYNRSAHRFESRPPVHSLIPKTFCCEMSKCDALKRGKASDPFTGKTEMKLT
jgi:hypothetical protein